MTSKAKALVALVFLSLLIIATATAFAFYYRGNAIDYKSQRDTATNKLNLAEETITDMQRRQKNVAALDAKYTQELADAKTTIDQLQRDVATGKRRLQLSATCPDSATSATGVVNGSRPQLTPDAERAYFRLRGELATAGKQIAGLQQYITEQCLR